MCVPLLERGNLIGVIYVGNDHVAQLFDESSLEVLTIFASQASLLIRNALLVNELQLDNRSLQERIERMRFGEILGASPVMQEVFRKVQKVAGHRHLGADHRRDRHRQGADRARAAQPIAAGQGAVRQHQLRRHPREPAGVRAVRPRARGVHRRGGQQDRAVPGGQQGHAVPRRDRRDAAAAAGEDPARAAGADGAAGGRHRRRAGRHPGASPPPTASWRRRSRPAASARTCTTG